MDTDFYGNDLHLGQHNASGWHDCVQKCQENPRCVSITFDLIGAHGLKIRNYCWLKYVRFDESSPNYNINAFGLLSANMDCIEEQARQSRILNTSKFTTDMTRLALQ